MNHLVTLQAHRQTPFFSEPWLPDGGVEGSSGRGAEGPGSTGTLAITMDETPTPSSDPSTDEDSPAHFLSDAGIELDADPQRIRACSPGETVMSAGEQSDWFGYLLSGELAVLGSEGLPLATVTPGSIIGEIGLLTQRPRTATLVALSAAKLWVGDRADLLQVFDSPEGSAWLRKLASTRLATAVGPITVSTTNGASATVRPALPSDGYAFREELRRMSRESIRNRFFSASTPPDSVIDYLLDADHFDHAVWAALDVGGAPIGSVRCIRSATDPSQAELAIGLADRAQGQGLGTVLVSVIGQVALELGITEITAEVLADNEPMRRLLKTPSTHTTHAEPGVVHSTLDPSQLADRLTPASQALISAATRSIVDGVYCVGASSAISPPTSSGPRLSRPADRC